jgi:hypothetical protein
MGKLFRFGKKNGLVRSLQEKSYLVAAKIPQEVLISARK